MALLNVNRTRTFNWNNDLYKFERDLKLKAVDELIEAMIETKRAYSQFMGIENMVEKLFAKKINLEIINSHLDNYSRIEYEALSKMVTKIKQRKFLIGKYEPAVKEIFEEGELFFDLITQMRQYLYIPDSHTIVVGTKDTVKSKFEDSPSSSIDDLKNGKDGTVDILLTEDEVKNIKEISGNISEISKSKIDLLNDLIDSIQNEVIVPYIPSLNKQLNYPWKNKISKRKK